MDVPALADLLHETSIRHGAFEAVAPKHDWWDWYAAYMDARDSGAAPPPTRPLRQRINTWRRSSTSSFRRERALRALAAPGEVEAAGIRGREQLAEQRATDTGGPEGEGRPRRLLDVHVHQLDPDAPIPPRVGGGVPLARPRRGRSAHSGVRDRARRRERAPGRGEMRVDYPIAIDNDYAVWNAFANQYWPALYIADVEGRIRHHQFGEGGYERSERVIRHLLADAGAVGMPEGDVFVDPQGIEAPADWPNVQSPETYVGLPRGAGFVSPRAQLPTSPVATRLRRCSMPTSGHSTAAGPCATRARR